MCIGGGTGTYSVLTGLKHYFTNLTAVVSMADTGGSARKERDEFGLLPSSDIRKALVALAESDSEEENILRELFQYRYTQGKGVSGMTFGNLFLVALTKLLGSQTKAIEKAGQILRIRGMVLPVSLDRVDLVATYENGMVVKGEHAIDEPKHDGSMRIKNLTTKPPGKVYPPVIDALTRADMIILGPGGLYTSIIANLVIEGVVSAIVGSRAKVVYILNLMTEYGQTHGFSASSHTEEIERYLGKSRVNYVIINNGTIPERMIQKYHASHAEPVIDDCKRVKTTYQVLRSDLLFPEEIRRVSGDTLKRSLVRHDPDKLAHTIKRLL